MFLLTNVIFKLGKNLSLSIGDRIVNQVSPRNILTINCKIKFIVKYNTRYYDAQVKKIL